MRRLVELSQSWMCLQGYHWLRNSDQEEGHDDGRMYDQGWIVYLQPIGYSYR